MEKASKKPAKYKNKKLEIDGHVFDSKLEGKYYYFLKQQQEAEKILFFRLQPRYLLHNAFEKNGKKYRKIEYIGDFEVHCLDGSIEVIDIKGAPPTEAFKIKEKLFNGLYPHRLLVITYSGMDGGWIEYEKLAELRKARKKRKAEKGGQNGQARKADSKKAGTKKGKGSRKIEPFPKESV